MFKDIVRGMEVEQAGEVSAKLGRIDRPSPLPIHQEGRISENPFDGQRVQIQLKTAIMFQGRECSELPAIGFESGGATIRKWLPHGIIIDGGYYIPASNILAISPYKTWAEVAEMREASQ
jgi:hypothetical protein